MSLCRSNRLLVIRMWMWKGSHVIDANSKHVGYNKMHVFNLFHTYNTFYLKYYV